MSERFEPEGPDEVIPTPPPQGGEQRGPSSSELVTSALIERAKSGDAPALNDLFTLYHGQMVELARRRLGGRLRQKEEADDLAQTTFREAARDFPSYQYRGAGSFLSWLMKILQNKIRDKATYYGATKRDIGRERSPAGMLGDSEDLLRFDPPSSELSAVQELSREEEFKILREALEALSPDHRKAITLVFFQDLSLREAGEQMNGRTEDAVRMLLRRAESHLHELTRSRLAK